MHTLQIYRLFAAKAVLLAVLGTIAGYLVALLLVRSITEGVTFTNLWMPSHLLILLAAANMVSISASLVPVMIAARRDPGIVLNEEA
ncbi:hypothetical protein H8D64_02220, partial [PVC group bacterium]|nr:hypothetical protein [PVC group bacterium]